MPMAGSSRSPPRATHPPATPDHPTIPMSVAAPTAQLLRRELSSSSHASATPIAESANGSGPLSPSSVGARTPRAKRQLLEGKEGELISNLDQLAVQSPASGSSNVLAQPLVGSPRATPVPDGDKGETNGHTGHAASRSLSTSTDSSSSRSGFTLPSGFGSMYNAEGFPAYPAADDPSMPTPSQRVRDEQIAQQIAQADEAIKQLNGTAPVVHAPLVPGVPSLLPQPTGALYELPRGFANFTRPQTKDEHLVTRQSSTSSTTTEASTSSEESDLCIPSIEWVNVNGNRALTSMPPPRTTMRRPSAAHQPSSIPLGASAGTPMGSTSALPPAPNDVPDEDEDDAQTIGHREQSPSTSSSTSGLDLLWQAARHTQGGQPLDHKRKAGAGAEAVAQWRTSGIPTGGSGSATGSAAPPKKRRRSELELQPDRAALMSPVTPVAESEDGSDDSEDVGASEDDDYHSARGGRQRGRGGARRSLPKKHVKKGRLSDPLLSPPPTSSEQAQFSAGLNAAGGGGGGSKLHPVGHGTVQCEYVNPLPPYQRCADVFTRKYDLPRHMARHARREGELVAEGRLTEEKAVLWRTIKDKPKVECPSCGESFTRMDALKRHQAKQHH